jgi:hypothetical protein
MKKKIKLLPMKILVKLPTKLREEQFFNTLDKFYSLCDDINNTIFVITLDNDDVIMNTDKVKEKFSNYKNLFYNFDNSTSKLYATNRDLNKYNEWDIMVLASDDTVPKIKGWDTVIREKMIENFPDTDGVLHFNDGFKGESLNTLPILGKKYFDRFGYVQYPGYKSCFADNEFMEVSKILNKVKYFDITVIEHQHPDWGFGQRDYAHDENMKYFNYDNNLFQERKINNFDLNL